MTCHLYPNHDDHRDKPTGHAKDAFDKGAFYAAGSVELALEWLNMGDWPDCDLYEIEVTGPVVMMDGWKQTARFVNAQAELEKPVFTDFGFGEGSELDLEACQIVVRLDQVTSITKVA